MNNPNDGGPAFPHDWWNHPSGECQPEPPHYGMSLRDYFAAKADPRQIFAEGGLPKWVAEIHMGCAMPATGKCPADNAAAEEWWMNALAWWKYRMADAMLVAKEGTMLGAKPDANARLVEAVEEFLTKVERGAYFVGRGSETAVKLREALNAAKGGAA